MQANVYLVWKCLYIFWNSRIMRGADLYFGNFRKPNTQMYLLFPRVVKLSKIISRNNFHEEGYKKNSIFRRRARRTMQNLQCTENDVKWVSFLELTSSSVN